ncbi:conserved hypothetical protein [Paecilomyces variotii No. 5]|uniref:CRIB domain-containing protein n=1 Tax=Byssochlamys spectabilis (strain No. 5 / NBRC 109023) TaxID=1356009 RepID=V5G0S0_BYSSN|nr:conserved hypothetical protein [Paecilomyces variotii No. 5]
MSIPYPTSPSSSVPKITPGAWQEDTDDQEQRPTTMASNDHFEPSWHARSRSIAQSQSPRRLSVFSGRSRSNTTTSTTTSLMSNRQSPASSMTSLDASSLRSQEERSGSTAGLEKESTSKSFFSRGSRIIRRQGSKFSISATLDEADEPEKEKEKEKEKQRVSELFSRKSRRSESHDHMKRIISDPFDFHHLTHTNPAQFQALDNASRNELVTEFSAIRASQKPVTQLKGIRAEDIHFRNFSDVDLSAYNPEENGEESRYGAAISPPVSPGTSAPVSPVRPTPEVSARLVDNFSRPVSKHQKVPSYPSIVPPPRVSSRLARSPDLTEDAIPAVDGNTGLVSPPLRSRMGSLDEILEPSRLDGANPVSPDETFDPNRSSYFTMHPSDLEDVPEEEEATFWREGSDHSSRPSTSRSFVHHEDDVSAVKASVVPKSREGLSMYIENDLSADLSATLGSPTLPQTMGPLKESPISQAEDLSRGVSSRRPTLGEAFLDNWDEDIDYCYEHAAESNCDFDWNRSSLEETHTRDATLPLQHPEATHASSRRQQKGALHSFCLDPADVATPDLEPGSSQSLTTTHSVATPSSGDALDYISSGKHNMQGDYFRASQLLPSTLGKEIPQETLYEEFLTADGASDRHFSFWSQRGSQYLEQPVSPRSSCSPISKCNSQESMILSRAASIVRKHRSSISTTSVPELVPSASSSREHMSQDSFGSFDPSAYSAGGPAATQGASSPRHRFTRSYGMDLSEMTRQASVPVQDKGRSVSTVDTHSAAAATSMMKEDGLPFAARMQSAALNKALGQKKQRSYSLFPTPPSGPPSTRK